MTAGAGEISFALHISSDEYLRYYQGAVHYVIARGCDGRTVQFPAGWLRRFLTHEGVHGEFRLCFDENNKLVSLEPVERGR